MLGAVRTRLEVSRSLCWIRGARVEPETNRKFSRRELEALTTHELWLLQQFVKQYYKLFRQFAPKESWYNNKACLCNTLSLLRDRESPVPINLNPCCIHLHKKLKPDEVRQETDVIHCIEE